MYFVVITNGEIKKRISLSKVARENLTNNTKLGSSNQHNYATVYNSLSSSAVWVQMKADKRKMDDSVGSKKDECISE
jgi:hypothetical protein